MTSFKATPLSFKATPLCSRGVFAFDVDGKRCEQYVGEMKKRIDAEVVKTDNLQEAVGQSDIVVTATPSSDPIINGDWVMEGCHAAIKSRCAKGACASKLCG